jgi:tetratricopeptide (TPR) repeat protein
MGYREDFNKALSLKNKDMFEESIKEFQKLKILYGETTELTGVMAMIYYSELHDLPNALKYAKKTVNLNPKNESASLCLFHSLFDLNRKTEAENEIRRYIKAGGQIKKYKVLFEENNLTIEDFS